MKRGSRPRSRQATRRSQMGFRYETPHSARGVAFAALFEHLRLQKFATTTLDRLLTTISLSDRDRRLATELVMTTVRRAATLDYLLKSHLQRDWTEIELPLQVVMRLGACQLLLMDSIPPHAALSESVELCKQLQRDRWTKFVNGVLRNLQRTLTDDFTTTPASDALPIAQGKYRKLNRQVFADPGSTPTQYFAAAFGYPAWLIDRWRKSQDRKELAARLFYFNAPPAVWLRINRLAIEAAEEQFGPETALADMREWAIRQLKPAGIEGTAGALDESIRLEQSARLESLPGFREGWFSVQDLTAMHVTEMLDPQPGESILDLCAAPGTKTGHLANRLRNQGSILATDISPDRLRRVQENIERLQLTCVATACLPINTEVTEDRLFDAILVDAPCSNTGVLSRRVEVRTRLTPHDLAELAERQKQILSSSLKHLRTGGRVVYSTCSIEPEENRHVVEDVVAAHPDLEFVRHQSFEPGQPADGGYCALLRKL